LGVLKLKNVHQAWLVPMCTIGHMHGMTVYIQGKSSACEQVFQLTQHEIHLLCIDFMEEFVRLSDKKTEVEEWFAGEFDKSSVSPREVDCLHWAARGKTNWEIGEIFKISENTVRYHLKNVFAKLGSNTRSSAVNRAPCVGIINI
jgi:DNA-binding CsgD family transcriptional regulator